MSKILFEITEDNLETGLRGYPCGYCTTSQVDPEKGLLYIGHPVKELATNSPEDVIAFLYFGKESEKKESFKKELRQRAHLSDKTIAAVRALPREGHPMKLFSSAFLLLGMLEGTRDYREDCLNLIAKVPYLAAVVINMHLGVRSPSVFRPELGYMESFVDFLGIPNKKKAELEPIFKLFNILHYDHGGGNLSAFVGKAVASGLEDLYGSLTSSMCALAGSRHGKANQDALLFVKELQSAIGKNGTDEEMETFLRTKLESGGLIFGFGHAVLRTEDPRAELLYDYADRKYGEHPIIRTASRLRKIGSKILKENPKISCPYPNIDAISGSLLVAAGFDYPEYFTVLFGVARTVGISIQIVYERTEARGGKGTPIVRPKYIYKERK